MERLWKKNQGERTGKAENSRLEVLAVDKACCMQGYTFRERERERLRERDRDTERHRYRDRNRDRAQIFAENQLDKTHDNVMTNKT